jgi:hypothetical protein
VRWSKIGEDSLAVLTGQFAESVSRVGGGENRRRTARVHTPRVCVVDKRWVSLSSEITVYAPPNDVTAKAFGGKMGGQCKGKREQPCMIDAGDSENGCSRPSTIIEPGKKM